MACGPGAVSHSSAFLCNRNNVKQCIQTLVCFTKNKMKKGEKRLTIHHTMCHILAPLWKTDKFTPLPLSCRGLREEKRKKVNSDYSEILFNNICFLAQKAMEPGSKRTLRRIFHTCLLQGFLPSHRALHSS